MGAIGRRMAGHSVRLFVKERRLAFYTAKYRKHPHVDVRVTSSDFADQLAASRGLIASPSRGVVTQARAWHVRTCTPCMHARAHPAGPCVC